jgi:phosphohistidine phosphatase
LQLYLVRHAEAVALGEDGATDDAERSLTPLGEEQAKRLAGGLLKHGVHLQTIVCSPLLRARQTAEGMLGGLSDPLPQLQVSKELVPGGKCRRLSRFLKKLNAEHVAVVGHQPDLGEFAAWLIGSKKARIEIDKAGVAIIVCDPRPAKGKGLLTALLPHEWIGDRAGMG